MTLSDYDWWMQNLWLFLLIPIGFIIVGGLLEVRDWLRLQKWKRKSKAVLPVTKTTPQEGREHPYIRVEAVELNSVAVDTTRMVVVLREDGNGVDLLPMREQAPECTEFENVYL